MFLNIIKQRNQAFHEYSSPYTYILTTTRDARTYNIHEYKIFIQTKNIEIHEFKPLHITSNIKRTQRDDIDQIGGKTYVLTLDGPTE